MSKGPPQFNPLITYSNSVNLSCESHIRFIFNLVFSHIITTMKKGQENTQSNTILGPKKML